MAFHPDLNAIKTVLNKKQYKIFENKKGYDLNIVGIRTKDTTADKFNDFITAFYVFEGQWSYFAFPATTDPGVYYRKHPLHVSGTAIMKPGQYRKAYKVGFHKRYKALQQIGPVTVYRDSDMDDELDTTGVPEDTGIHALNIHKASAVYPSETVGKWSAGCQVFQDSHHFEFFMTLCDKAKDIYGNEFTYTLIEEADFT